jgi:hypothetical protein
MREAGKKSFEFPNPNAKKHMESVGRREEKIFSRLVSTMHYSSCIYAISLRNERNAKLRIATIEKVSSSLSLFYSHTSYSINSPLVAHSLPQVQGTETEFFLCLYCIKVDGNKNNE